jgi:3-mercaptopropionate dioxygenase
LSVFLVKQAPLTAGPPHDHGIAAGIVMLKGKEIHRLFRRTGSDITPDGVIHVGPGEVLILRADEVHAIANPDPAPSIGVHVYLGDIVGIPRTLWDPASGASMAFSTADYDRMVVRAPVPA